MKQARRCDSILQGQGYCTVYILKACAKKIKLENSLQQKPAGDAGDDIKASGFSVCQEFCQTLVTVMVVAAGNGAEVFHET